MHWNTEDLARGHSIPMAFIAKVNIYKQKVTGIKCDMIYDKRAPLKTTTEKKNNKKIVIVALR